MLLAKTDKVLDFKGYSFGEKFGFVQNGDHVEYIWCKTFTKARDEVTRQMQIRGKVKDDQLACTKQVPLVKYIYYQNFRTVKFRTFKL